VCLCSVGEVLWQSSPLLRGKLGTRNTDHRLKTKMKREGERRQSSKSGKRRRGVEERRECRKEEKKKKEKGSMPGPCQSSSQLKICHDSMRASLAKSFARCSTAHPTPAPSVTSVASVASVASGVLLCGACKTRGDHIISSHKQRKKDKQHSRGEERQGAILLAIYGLIFCCIHIFFVSISSQPPPCSSRLGIPVILVTMFEVESFIHLFSLFILWAPFLRPLHLSPAAPPPGWDPGIEQARFATASVWTGLDLFLGGDQSKNVEVREGVFGRDFGKIEGNRKKEHE
jgi:hypothetical protein